jgi:hypothetical protein
MGKDYIAVIAGIARDRVIGNLTTLESVSPAE